MANTRRSFLVATTAMAATSMMSPLRADQDAADRDQFTLAFAPHPRMFKTLAGDDVLDQIKFAHDQGFMAWEDNSMPKAEPAMQEKIGNLLRDLKMRMGVFVAYGDFERPTFTVKKAEYRDEVLKIKILMLNKLIR